MELEYIKVTPKEDKAFPCPHNEGVDCCRKDCYHCGWNPTVAKIRLDRIRREAEA